MRKTFKNKKGFTLIELLVVIAIIAILALVTLLAINPVEMARRSRDSRRLSDLGTLRRAIDLSLADGKTLPVVASGPITSTDATLFPNGAVGDLDISKYLSTVPQDPSYDAAGGTLQVVQTGAPCTPDTTFTKDNMVYTFWSDGSVYVLSAHLESIDNCNALNQDGNATNNTYDIGTDPGLDST